ncbi:hypothetical protein PIB30_085337, partial [Stylosanthes scabra]|nr:hypothetical protein [Stylosanthes scabra]
RIGTLQRTSPLPPCELARLGGWATDGSMAMSKGQSQVTPIVVGIGECSENGKKGRAIAPDARVGPS